MNCDTCGEPATVAVADVGEIENHATGYVEYESVGTTRYGCDDHPVRSVVMYRTQKWK